MAGNAIDRSAAEAYLKKTDAHLIEATERAKTAGAKVYDLSEIILASDQGEGRMPKVYKTMLEALSTFNTTLANDVPGMVDAVRASINAAGGDVGYKSNYKSTITNVAVDQSYNTSGDKLGITDYSQASDAIKALYTAFDDVSNSLKWAVENMKGLWNLATESGFALLADSANNAADSIRTVAENLELEIDAATKDLNTYVLTSENISKESVQEINKAVADIQKQLTNFDFVIPQAE